MDGGPRVTVLCLGDSAAVSSLQDCSLCRAKSARHEALGGGLASRLFPPGSPELSASVVTNLDSRLEIVPFRSLQDSGLTCLLSSSFSLLFHAECTRPFVRPALKLHLKLENLSSLPPPAPGGFNHPSAMCSV